MNTYCVNQLDSLRKTETNGEKFKRPDSRVTFSGSFGKAETNLIRKKTLNQKQRVLGINLISW